MAKDNFQRVVTPESELARACPKCGVVSKAFGEFCPNCGAKTSKSGGRFSRGFMTFLFIFLNPLWVILALSDSGSTKFEKFCAFLLLIGYVIAIIVAIANS